MSTVRYTDIGSRHTRSLKVALQAGSDCLMDSAAIRSLFPVIYMAVSDINRAVSTTG